MEPTAGTKRRGFASMTKERRKEIATLGGKAAWKHGTAHKWTPEEAQAAGRKSRQRRVVADGAGDGTERLERVHAALGDN